MTLAIDLGNTRIKLGLFDKQLLKEKVIWETWDLKKLSGFLYNHQVKKIILSSVVEVKKDIEKFFSENFVYYRLDSNTPLPINNLYETPQTLGKDRIAAIMGAYQIFPKNNCLVIDAGTCITFDLLTENAEYLGGNISPGVEMRLKAMHHFTAKLPLIERGKKQKLWGVNTETAMRNGGQFGAVWEMRAFIKSCQRKFGQLNVLLTGGDADFFAKHLKTKIFVHPNLVLFGLNEILQYNVEYSQK